MEHDYSLIILNTLWPSAENKADWIELCLNQNLFLIYSIDCICPSIVSSLNDSLFQ